jgi:hypothetical protein
MGLGLFCGVHSWGRCNQAVTLKCRARPNFWPEDDRDAPRREFTSQELSASVANPLGLVVRRDFD